jgi:xanthine/CO dehydrogenase XdhC/CoxF family maturation factor
VPRVNSTYPSIARSKGSFVKHWQETASIFARIAASDGRAGQALATVVRIAGSAYRRLGARLLVAEDGATSGGVSGGCLEADVREVALEVIRSGTPRLRHYQTGSDADTVWGLGLGCEGAVDILVQPVDGTFREVVIASARELAAGAAPFALAMGVGGPRVGWTAMWARGRLAVGSGDRGVDAALERQVPALAQAGTEAQVEAGPEQVFVEVLSPPPHLLVFGAGDDALPLVRLAAGVGFDVSVIDHRPALLTPGRFELPARLVLRRPEAGLEGLGMGRRCYAVVQTLSLAHDREWVRALLHSPVAYLGLLGPRGRREDLLEEIGARPGDRLFAPVGLDLGADGPEQVAVSVVAELLAVESGRSPRHLRDRTGAIHAG